MKVKSEVKSLSEIDTLSSGQVRVFIPLLSWEYWGRLSLCARVVSSYPVAIAVIDNCALNLPSSSALTHFTSTLR